MEKMDVAGGEGGGGGEAGPPPAPFLEEPGQKPPVRWSSWICSFERLLARLRCSEKADLLLLYLGKGGRQILRSLHGPTGTYEAMVKALTDHFNAEKKKRLNKTIIITAASVGAGLLVGVGAVVAAPFILAGIGFASGGIVAGSLAASMMSSAAVASGGGVAAGSLVAILQSAGAVGLTAAASAAVAGTGAAVGGAVGGATAGVITSMNSKSDDKKDPKDGANEDEEDDDPKKHR